MKRKHLKKGSVIILLVIVFAVSSVALSLSISPLIIGRMQNIREIFASHQAYYSAEAINEEKIYKAGYNISP
ncbi:MAG: hypothetical protein WCO12_02500 [bacterium]